MEPASHIVWKKLVAKYNANEILATELLIRATQTHRVPSDFGAVNDLQYFLDFDMAVLGAEREVYREYKENVRKEFRLIPAALYRPGRKKFLETCLQSKFIFHTDSFRARYETKARSNLQWELETDYQ